MKKTVNSPQPFIIERTFNAPIQRVWQAITDKTQMKQWYFDLPKFKPEVGCEFEFIGCKDKKEFIHLCKVTEVIAGKRLTYSWRYKGFEGNSFVTFELFAEGKATRLKLTHTGLETFPKSNPDLAKKNFVQGWTSIIGTSLKKFLESGDTSDREIIITRVINASRERIWEAMTNPKQVTKWWGPTGFTTTTEKMEVKPGGVWKHMMHGPDGTDYPNKSIFIEVVKPERISYALAGGKKGGNVGAHFVSTWTFEALGKDKTKVTMHGVFPTAKDRDHVVKTYNAIEGGKQTLARLDEYLANKN